MTAHNSTESSDNSEAILSTARSVIRTCLQVRREEDVLVITDPETSEVGQALYEEAARVTDRILLVMMPPTQKPGKEPPLPVSDIMRKNRVIIIATKDSLTHTRARQQATKEGARIVSMPGIGRISFESGGMTADYNALQREISGMGSVFRRKRRVRVKSSNGTDVEFLTGGRWILEDNGICNRPSQVSNLPAGKVFVLPKEESMNGTIVIDGSWEGRLLEEPISFQIKDGVVIEITGGKIAEDISSVFEVAKTGIRSSKRDKVWTVAEFGFGMNPKATEPVGNKVEDLVVRGSSYFGFGDNTHIGGTARVGIHLRGMIVKPEIILEDSVIVDDGKITVR
ncbi:MAG TPA: aminopeptidase [Candidatus Thalassarchaeaceae archaeon]|nr:aminopeptidase [Candidatus Thalassarchaeaceae archaeon]